VGTLIGAGRRAQVKQVTETVTRAVKSAGSLVVAALAVACVALVVSLGALVVALKARPARV
jgi:hypothetical protein